MKNSDYACGYCTKPTNDKCNYKSCKKCMQTLYCSKDCQVIDWPSHKIICKKISSEFKKNAELAISRCSSIESLELTSNLLEYCISGNLAGIANEVTIGFDVNMRNLQLQTPLILAAANGHEDCLLYLLEHGASPNLGDKSNFTALFASSQFGHDKCVSLLLQHGANPNITDNEKSMTPLFMACQKGHDNCVALLLQHGANPDIANTLSFTPLFIACGRGYDKCVSLLVKNGATLNVFNIHGRTPLYIACVVGNIKCIALLLENGADLNEVDKNNGFALIHASCYSGKVNVLSYVISIGADINALTRRGVTPIQLAYAFGHDKCVQLLKDSGADDSNMENPSVPIIEVCDAFT